MPTAGWGAIGSGAGWVSHPRIDVQGEALKIQALSVPSDPLNKNREIDSGTVPSSDENVWNTPPTLFPKVKRGTSVKLAIATRDTSLPYS